jgi:hypothetical protein
MVGIVASVVGGIFGLICFIVITVGASKLPKIEKHLRRLAKYEKIRMLEAGLIDPEHEQFTRWKIGDDMKIVKNDTPKTP